MQIQLKWKNKLFELFCGPILNYDRNDDNHDYKNNSHDNFNNDSKASEIEIIIIIIIITNFYTGLKNPSVCNTVVLGVLLKQKDKETSLKCWRFISNANYQLCI